MILGSAFLLGHNRPSSRLLTRGPRGNIVGKLDNGPTEAVEQGPAWIKVLVSNGIAQSTLTEDDMLKLYISLLVLPGDT